MREQSVQQHGCPSQWLTTSAVARMLERTPRSVRRFAEDGAVAAQRAENGYRLFRQSDVLQLVEHRAKARLRGVTALRPKRMRVRGEPQQLALFDRKRMTNSRPKADVDHA